MRWQMDGELTQHLNSIRDAAEFRAIMADIEADIGAQERDFDPTSL